MREKLINFLKYNNAAVLIFVLCFLGFGVTFAASPSARDSVYSSRQSVVSDDNHAILAADLDNFDFSLRIESVTQDNQNYYVNYAYHTLLVQDNAWKNSAIAKTLKVRKEALAGRDLGLYAEAQLSENMNAELAYLKRAKKIQQDRGETQKIVVEEYAGLIGKLLNPAQKIIEGYVPVIPALVKNPNGPDPDLIPFQAANPQQPVDPINPVNPPPTNPPPVSPIDPNGLPEALPVASTTPDQNLAPEPEPTPDTEPIDRAPVQAETTP